MAQPPQIPPGFPQLQQATANPPWLPAGFNFQPNGRFLVANFLAPKALSGRLPEDLCQEAVIDGVDVYRTPPEALPFHSYNSNTDTFEGVHRVWSHFYATRPAEAATRGFCVVRGGGARGNAPCGFWRRYGGEKAYASEGGDAFAFRRLFAFYEWRDGGGKLTPWRMKEFRMNEGAAAFRGVAFHPTAKDLVVLKVYSEVEIPGHPPARAPAGEDDGNDDNNHGDPGQGLVVGL